MSRWRCGVASLPPPPGTRVKAVNEIRITRHGEIEAIEAIGEFDLSNVEGLDDALQTALSRGPAASCLLDLSAVTFMDSTVLKALVRWSKETQVSEREGLAILVGDPDSPASKVLKLVGLAERLPIFSSLDAAMAALQAGKKPRSERPLRWLTDPELASEREHAQAGSDTATQRLADAIAEQDVRRQEAAGSVDE
jgi:anti-sigma B factor antagonist